MKYRIETKEAIRIVGIRTALKEEVDDYLRVVPTFWDETLKSDLFSQICKLSNQIPHGILGVTVYQSPKEIYYYIAASTNQIAPDNLIQFEIPSATWVVFECDGRFPESVKEVFKYFLTEWLPFSEYEYAQLPDIEVYPISNTKPNERHTEIWIAIKEENKEE